ncbi:MAG: hypothetical protein IKJ45_15855 [Kiritimatiellae bacterium]|nr:hypothetical protein [Kiritimatiellia bacterium]
MPCYRPQPTNATDVFRTVISIGGDGEPVIGWEAGRDALVASGREVEGYVV